MKVQGGVFCDWCLVAPWFTQFLLAFFLFGGFCCETKT